MSTSGIDTSGSSAIYSSINSANKATSTSSKTTGDGSISEAQDTFLKLLTTQLTNQDPLNPLDNAQMTSQLAQISTVDGIGKLNATMQAMLTNSADSQAMQAAALVGHAVLAAGNGLQLSSGAAVGGIDLATAADQVVVTVKDANGLVVRTLNLGAAEAGASPFSWDGATDSGAVAADGNYRISVSALQGGKEVKATALEYAAVTSVTKSSQGISLTAGNLGTIALSDIKQII